MTSASRRSAPVAAAGRAGRASQGEKTPPPNPAAATPFVVGPAADLGLMVASPLWIIPLVFGLAGVFKDKWINDTVAALGAIGHHLPGMLRAYGDRELFARFRVRFLVAPVVLIVMCALAMVSGVQSIIVIAFVWGVWHALAQAYGFARIYAVKAGCGDRPSALADQALLIAWFLAALACSPLRLGFILDKLATCGLGLPTPSVLSASRTAALVVAGVATVAWVVVVVRGALQGRGPGGVRLLLLASSIGFWWFANVRVRHLLLAAPLFELAHDAQYLAIVWVFNRRRVEAAGDKVAEPLRALFRPSAGSILAYVAVCFAYGAFAFWAPKPQLVGQPDVAGEGFGLLLSSAVAASQLLHFYYDGFIWKVREPQTAGVLGVSGPQGPRALLRASSWPALRHALLWGLLLVGYGGFWIGESRAAMPMPERGVKVSELVPDNALYRGPAAEYRWQHGEREAALEGFRFVLSVDPGRADLRRNLALSLAVLADEKYKAFDAAGLLPLAREIAAIAPGLDDETAKFIAERLGIYATLK